MHKEFSPMSVAELMDKVMDVYKKAFWKHMAFAAIISLISFVVVFAMSIVLFLIVGLLMFAAQTGGARGGHNDAIVGIVIIIVIAYLPTVVAWQSFSTSGHILLSRKAFLSEKILLKKMGLFSVIISVITAVIANVLVSLPFIGVAFVFAFALTLSGSSYTVVIVTMLIIGFLYLLMANLFSLSIAVAAFERRYFFDALMRSYKLVKVDFWRIFGIQFLWILAIIAFSLSGQGLLGLVSWGWSVFSGTANMGVIVNVIVMFFSTVVGPIILALLIAPLYGIMQSIIYFNQRMKHEAYDLELRLEKL